ncbi:hypothetical protein NQ315_002026 [Exocentrus adspersus]|uniref:Uncharacterized protein n=1 Tax=Exocentrus adspersus TaxID=1586481 RepID=A0AAV8V9B4_9CUCU|nr:hypothetical protein NQ315_002026 [Exocentrus adspersus]
MEIVLVLLVFNCVICELNLENCCNGTKQLTSWEGSWTIFPTATTWSLRTRIPMLADFSDSSRQARGKYKIKKKYKKYFLPLLLAYKLKFFTLIPVLIGGLVLLTGATGLAGFFFALFAAVMGLKSGHQRSKWRSLI